MPTKTLQPDDDAAKRYEDLRKANLKPGKPLSTRAPARKPVKSKSED